MTRKEKLKKLELLREKKRRCFYSFFSNTITRFVDSQFYHDVGETLQNFNRKSNNLEFPHLIMNVAPRVGKSAMILRYCLWCMLQDPGHKVIYATYGNRLSETMSRDLKLILESDYIKKLWPNISLKAGNSALDSWSLTNGSSIFFTSVGGAVSGVGANTLALDDIFADLKQANSLAYKEQLFSWVQSAFLTRVLPEKHSVIFLFTRWVVGDLAGFIEKQERNDPLFPKFDKIQFPIIKDGKLLIPERFDERFIESMKAKVGSKIFDALFLCNPQSSTDKVIKSEWIEQVDRLPAINWVRDAEIVVGVDTAFKKTNTSDYNVAVCVAKCQGKYYLLDYIRMQADFADWINKFTDWYKKIPRPKWLIIEDKANGSSMKSVLQSKFSNIKMTTPTTDKVTRISGIAPAFENGKVVFLRKNTAEYNEILEEIDNFPNSSYHDDFIDALEQPLAYWLEKEHSNIENVDWGKLIGG